MVEAKSSAEELAQMLNASLSNTAPSNIEQNRTLWNNYAREWTP